MQGGAAAGDIKLTSGEGTLQAVEARWSCLSPMDVRSEAAAVVVENFAPPRRTLRIAVVTEAWPPETDPASVPQLRGQALVLTASMPIPSCVFQPIVDGCFRRT